MFGAVPHRKIRGRAKALTPCNRLAEVHGNRTHLPPYSDGTPDLKTRPRHCLTYLKYYFYLLFRSAACWLLLGFIWFCAVSRAQKRAHSPSRAREPVFGLLWLTLQRASPLVLSAPLGGLAGPVFQLENEFQLKWFPYAPGHR